MPALFILQFCLISRQNVLKKQFLLMGVKRKDCIQNTKNMLHQDAESGECEKEAHILHFPTITYYYFIFNTGAMVFTLRGRFTTSPSAVREYFTLP